MFGKAGADLLPLFEKGAAGIRAAREEAQKLGLSFSDETLKKLSDADEAIKRMKESWSGVAGVLTADVAPALTRILNHLVELKTAEPSAMSSLLKKGLLSGNPLMMGGALGLGLALPSEAELKAQRDGRFGTIVRPDKEAKAPGFAAAKKASEDLTEVTLSGVKMQRDVYQDYYTELDDRTKTSSQKQHQQLMAIQAALIELRDTGLITADQYRERWGEAFDALDGEIEEVETSQKRLADAFTTVWDEMPDRATEASMRARDAFEGFFFDPMRDGIKGLARNLLDSLRASIAQSMTDSLFGSKKSGGAGWGSAIAGFGRKLFGFADGGSFDGKSPFMVGERGPEIIVPSGSGSVIPNHKLGGGTTVVINQVINAQGASMDLAKALPSILKAHGEALKSDLINGIRRGKYAV